MMRILVVQESNWLTRGPHQQHHLMERLQARGNQVLVIDFEVDWRDRQRYSPIARGKRLSAPGKALREQRIRVIRPPMVRAPLLSYVCVAIFHPLAVIKAINEFRPDVIVGLGILNSCIAARIAKLHGIPFILYLIDSLHTLIPEKLLRPIGLLLEKRALTLATKVLAINNALGEYATRIGKNVRTEIVTAGIEKRMFDRVIDGARIRRKLQIPSSSIVLFFMGYLYKFSGLIEVAKSLAHVDSGIVLLVVGRGDLADELNELQEKEEIRGKLKLVNWVSYEEISSYLAAADICLLPALPNQIMRDIVPIKLYEYLASGKPVIATRLPGVMKEFGNTSGVTYVKGPDHVVSKATQIASDTEYYNRLKREALEFTHSLDWSSIVDEFYSIMHASQLH